jgi:hypothetical protein
VPVVRACGILLALVLLAPPPLTSARQTAPSRILFIGNSLTAANNLPAMVEALCASGNGPRVTTSMVAFPDHSLEDHWKRGDAVKRIAAGGWSAVVLQQGPSALPESRALLVEYAKKFDGEARRVGAKTALYMVWPSAARSRDFDGVRASYEAAAREVNGIFLPAGDAWRIVWRREPDVELYGPDGFHPTAQATYLAALVIVEGLTRRSPIGLPISLSSPTGAFAPLAVPRSRAALFQEAAAEANRQAAR